MKSNTSTWLAVLIITIFGLTNIHPAIAGGTPTDPNATAVTTEPTSASYDTILEPWLVLNGKKVERLSFTVSGSDTTYQSKIYKDCDVKPGNVHWYFKCRSGGNGGSSDAATIFAQKTANRASYASFRAMGYAPREADSLYRKMLQTMDWKMLDAIAANSPNAKQLRDLESNVTQLTSNLAQMNKDLGQRILNLEGQERSFATKSELTTLNTTVSRLDTTVAVSNAANDAQWSRTRGKSWEKTKEAYGLVIIQAPQPKQERKDRMPRRRSNL